MPDTDAPSRSEPVTVAPVNLPMPLPRPSDVVRDQGETWIGRLLRSLFGWKSGSIRADLEVVLGNGGQAETGFSPKESSMLRNILGLRERRIEDVMVPRADIVAVQQDILLGELIKVFEGVAHSRLVTYNDTLDDPVGMVHIRDVIGYMVRKAAVDPEANAKRKKPFPAGLDLKAVDLSVPLSAARIVRPLLFVPPSMPATDLLAKMQATRIHLALVIDEYGGTDGIVSIEDIVEQIVGDIADEHDEDVAPAVIRQADGSFLADARASLEDVVAVVGADFDVGEVEVDTLAGYLMTRVGRLPSRGEVLPGPAGFEIEVLDADPRRIKRVRITRKDLVRRERSPRRRETLRLEATPVQPATDHSSASDRRPPEPPQS